MKKSAFLTSSRFQGFDYGRSHPLKMERLALVYDFLKASGVFDLPNVAIHECEPIEESKLLRFHTLEYIDVLAFPEKNRENPRYYGIGPGDNPLADGVYEYSRLSCGGSAKAARLVLSGEADTAFNIAGGLHHAMPNMASGFCYLNDPVMAINELLDASRRVVCLDIDAHHGDGVQAAYYDTDRVMTISIHEDPTVAFPGTGFPDDIGTGAGKYFSVNLPMLSGSGDRSFHYLFHEAAMPLIRKFSPDVIVTQLGADLLACDPLTRINVSLAAYTETVRAISDLDIPWVALGGGGYNLANVAAGWGLAFGVMAGIDLSGKLDIITQIFPGAGSYIPGAGFASGAGGSVPEGRECMAHARGVVDLIKSMFF